MSCTPTRMELSNAAATTVTITLATDPGDGTTVTLEVDGLGIDTSATTSGGSVSYSIPAVSAANNSIWDATIQVGSNRPATAEVLVVETNTTQAIGVTIDDSSVTYCAPSAGGGGSGTVTSVGLSVPGGFTVAGTNPITTSGTFEITSSLSGIIKGDGAATFSGDGVINDLADVNIAMGAGNQDDILYYDHAAGAGSKIKGIARSSISLSEFNDDLDYAASSHTHSASDITTGTLSDARLDLRVDAGATFDGQGSAVASAESVLVPIERSGVITAASLIADAPGSITITVKRYTPSAGSLGAATTLGTIALASAQHNRDTTLSGWTTVVSAGDVLEFLTGGTIATVERVTVKVKIEES